MDVISFDEFLERGKKKPFEAVFSIGVFDGVHYGHRAILETLRRKKEELRAALSLVFTFSHNPKGREGCLDTLRLRSGYIASYGVDILVLIDYTKPSTQERLYVIDMRYGKVLYKSLVAHGRGSGDNYATSFSNTPDSHKSSLGFYLTLNTYEGRNGYSLRLNGLEPGINDKAYERAIVIHGADYCDRSFIKSAGRLGRSFGCPALPRDVSDAIIDTIKDGAVLFIYADNEKYMAQSAVLIPNDLAMN